MLCCLFSSADVKEKEKEAYLAGPALFIALNSINVSQMCFLLREAFHGKSLVLAVYKSGCDLRLQTWES